MTALVLSPVEVAVDGGAEEGMLILWNNVLVAVLTRLESAIYGSDRGRWHLEAGFGRCGGQRNTFATLETAVRWVAERLEIDADAAVASVAAGLKPPCNPP